MGEGAGRPTVLTDELFGKIKGYVFEGRTLKEMAELSGIAECTIYEWSSSNYLGFYDKVEGWRRDSHLEKADKNFAKILSLDPSDKDYIRSVADISKFVKETLDKPHYSKRTELGGIDGKDLQINLVTYADNHSVQVPTEAISITAPESTG
jgi:hypothetical protein